MNIRIAGVTDFSGIIQIATDIYKSIENKAQFNWPELIITAELEAAKTLVIDVGSEIASFVSYRDLPDYFEITVLATRPFQQKKHFQIQLLLFLQELAARQRKTILLEVHENNTSALCLYQKLGFTELHLRPKYYLDDAAAVVMRWESNKAGC